MSEYEEREESQLEIEEPDACARLNWRPNPDRPAVVIRAYYYRAADGHYGTVSVSANGTDFDTATYAGDAPHMDDEALTSWLSERLAEQPASYWLGLMIDAEVFG